MSGKWEVVGILALAIVSLCVNPRCVIGAAGDIRPIAGRGMPLNGIMSPEYHEGRGIFRVYSGDIILFTIDIPL